MTKKRKIIINWSTIFWTIGILLWVASVLIIAQYAIAYPMHWILGDAIAKPVWTTVYSAVVYALSLLLIVVIPWKITLSKKGKRKSTTKAITITNRKLSRDDLGLKDLPTWTDIMLAPCGFIVYFILAMIVTAIFSFLPWFDLTQTQDVGFNNLFGSDRIIAFIALVVVAPIAEEVIFRGWLYAKLRSRLSIWLAILLTSILFGIMHGQWNVGVNVFALSIVLCGLREVTGTIYSGILLHMLKNGVAFYLLYIIGFM